MPRRKRWWYRSDLFAVLGLLLLVAWVPAYLALDEEERVAHRTDGWAIREPRVGDGVVIDLVVTWADGTERVLREVLTVSYRPVEEGEIPQAALFAEERVTSRIDVRIGGVHLYAEPAIETVYYDDMGHPVYRANRGTYTDIGFWESGIENETIEVESRQWELGFVHQMGGLPKRFEHTTSTVKAAFETMREQKRLDDRTLLGSGAATYGGTLLFAGDGEHHLDEMIPVGSAGYQSCIGNGRGSSWWSGILVMTEAGHCRGTGWDWYVPDFPVPVGKRIPALTADFPERFGELPKIKETLGHFDLVPTTIERGTGDTLPFPRSVPWGYGREATPGPAPDPQVPLWTVEEREEPLLFHASLKDVVALLDEPEVPENLRALREDGARVAGFIWVVHGIAEGDVDLPPELKEILPADEAPSFDVTWELLLYADQDRWSVAGLATEMGEDGSVSLVAVEDLCREIRTCDPEQLPDVDLDRDVVAPEVFLGPIRDRLTDGTEIPGVFFWAPHYTASGGAFPPRATYERLPRAVDSAPALGAKQDGGVVTWAKDWRPDEEGWFRFGVFNLADGSEVADVRWRSLDAQSAPVALEPLAQPLHIIEPPLPLIGAGLFLIFLSLFIRGLRYLLGGGKYGLIAVGYAKIVGPAVLTHERRQEIMALVRAEPGVTPTQVQRRLQYGWGATVHHLETLVKAGALTSVQFGRRRHYYPKEGLSAAERLRLAAAHDPEAARLLEVVRERPGATARDLTTLTGRSRTAVSRTATRLERSGLLEKRRDGARVRFHPIEV